MKDSHIYITRRQAINFCCGLVFSLVLGACDEGKTLPSEVATVEKPAISPSGKYILVVINGGGALNFEIQEKTSKKNIYSSEDIFYLRFTNFFLWDKSDRVWVYSGDVGTFFWERNRDTGKWEKYSYSACSAVAPDFLQQVRPKYLTSPPEVATAETPAISLSGKYLLAVTSHWDRQVRRLGFQILDLNKQILYSPPERFAARRKTYILWDKEERVWCYSQEDESHLEAESNTITNMRVYFWERESDKKWIKRSYFGTNTPVPEVLKWFI